MTPIEPAFLSGPRKGQPRPTVRACPYCDGAVVPTPCSTLGVTPRLKPSLRRTPPDDKEITMFEPRLAELILTGHPFSADDLTRSGAVAIDGRHGANGAQSGIGSFVQKAAQRGLIAWTGTVVRSQAPHRKGGAIRTWTGTEAGRAWAHTIPVEP